MSFGLSPAAKNGSSSILSAGSSFAGEWERVAPFNTVTAAVKTDQDGTLYMEFSPDGENADSSLSFSVAANVNEVHRLTITRLYYRTRFTNTSGSAQTYFRLQTLFGSNQPTLTSALNSTINSDADSLVTRSILYGETDGGDFVAVPATTEGHIEVAVHDPQLPFKSLHVENLTSVFQFDAVYQLNDQLTQTVVSGSGAATTENSSFKLNTGTTVGSYSVLTSRKRLRYRPGQGTILRFTALFPTATASSINVAGLGHPEDGYFFATSGTQFGILSSKGGAREVRTLTISVGSSTGENVTVKLNGTDYTVAVTNSGNVYRTAYEISRGTFTGWYAEPVGATVRFINSQVGAKSGAYSLTATTAVGSFAQTRAGSANTDTFIAQSSWNVDVMDGTGRSGITLDYTKYNIYQIEMAYLGAGNINFKVMSTPSSGNNSTWVSVHTIRNTNSLTNTHTGNPSMPFTAAVYSAGSTTDLTMKIGSAMGAVEGNKILHGNRLTYVNQLTTVGATNLQALFTVKNERYFAGRSNQSVVNLLSVTGAIKHTSPVIYYLIRNGTLAGNPNFSQISTYSCTTWDSAATTVTYSTGEQLLWTGHLGDTGEIDHHFNGGRSEELTLQPGEWVTLAAKATTGTPSWVTGSINTREDQ